MQLEINKIVNLVLFLESVGQTVLMVIDTLDEIAGYTGVEGAVTFARQKYTHGNFSTLLGPRFRGDDD